MAVDEPSERTVTEPVPAVGDRRDARVADRSDLARMAASVGLRRVHFLGWRDLEDPEAGGSELHAATIAGIWAAAGIDVTMRSSTATGRPIFDTRDGYRVIRKAGRYTVFPRTAASGLIRRAKPGDALVEIWNGMPFFSPVWAHCPHIVFLHHVHADMWRTVVRPEILGRAGEVFERSLAPRFYRQAHIVTLSQSSKQEIVEVLGLPPSNISVVPPGIDPLFAPGGRRTPHPLIVSAGRLVQVKRFDMLLDCALPLRAKYPDLEVVIVGEGNRRTHLERQIELAGAGDWVKLRGRLSRAELVDLYQQAWVVCSASEREGWGMTLTEAAACGTPAVATRIPGHLDAVVEGTSGLLADSPGELTAVLDRVLSDGPLRARLGAGARARAAHLTWEKTAAGALRALVREFAHGNAVTRTPLDSTPGARGGVIDLRI